MKSAISKPQPAVRSRPARSALNWVDFLVIAAIVATFATIIGTTLNNAKAATVVAPETASSTRLVPADERPSGSFDPALVKARIRLASGGPWG